MCVLRVFLFGYVFSSVIMGGSSLQTISSASGERLVHNFIEFKSAPDKVADGAAVHVRYRCLGPCRLAVEVTASTLGKTDLVLFRRRWIGRSPGGAYRNRQVRPTLPPSILYRHDFFNRHVLEVDNVTVRAWLDDLSDGAAPGTYDESALKIHKVLEGTPLSARPPKPPTASLSWFARLMWRTNGDAGSRCPRREADVVEVLSFPLASTGEYFGLVRRFQPFMDGALERGRLHAVTQPSVTLSAWIYLLEWCRGPFCGIIHHVDGSVSYQSVVMQLTDTGGVIIQARLTSGEDEAFQISAALPLQKWIRLDCHIHNSKVVLDLSWDDEMHRFISNFKDSIYYDDTDGYFVIGGSRFLQGIHGYFGPVKFYRFGTEQIKNELRLETLRELEKTHHRCREIKAFARAFLKEVTESHVTSTRGRDVCVAHFIRLRGQYQKKRCTRTWTWGTPRKYSALFHFLRTREERLRTGFLGLRELGTALFNEAADAMFTADRIPIASESETLLQTSSCFGNQRASLLLAAVYLTGPAPANRIQGHVYSLMGAAGDGRFALMHAGYKHAQGIDGFPKDLDVAYSYYSNAAAQCTHDLASVHEDEQYILQHVYLSHREDLQGLTDETSDAFQYLRFLAERGDEESQRRLGRMLYWGQNGVSKDIASAVKWLQRSSMQMKDPSAMYDYSILLMKGRGVKRNYTRGLELLKKAADMGSVEALNGLGWYHGMVLNDHGSAARYFEEAALNGSSDGMYNLGVYHLNGANPQSPWRNETAAFLNFLNASGSGHAAASVEAAWYLSTGSLEGVSQDVESAVIMLKKVCEQNGHLGFMIRQGLWAYLRGSRREALLKYVLAAEAGLGLAQSNAAHLCEELDLSPDWRLRYHNHSLLNHDPHPSALLKMGDFYYYSSSAREDSLSLLGQAVSMYSRAALAGSPQGMFNLAALAWQGHALPRSVAQMFGATRYDGTAAVVEKILTRCVQSEHEEAVTPCSLALLGVQMGKAFSRMMQTRAQLLLTYASLLSACVLIVFMPFQSRPRPKVRRHLTAEASASTLSRAGGEMNGEQNGIMGGTGGAAGTLRRAAVNVRRWLRQTSDLAVTLSGVCVCVFWTTFLYHLL